MQNEEWEYARPTETKGQQAGCFDEKPIALGDRDSDSDSDSDCLVSQSCSVSIVSIRLGLTFKTIRLLFAGDVKGFNLFAGLPKRLKEKHRGHPLAVSGYSHGRTNQSVDLFLITTISQLR